MKLLARIPGIHHVTAIAGEPQPNVDFYAGALGLRLVKKTVNFDDPGTYHLYFGDESGSPGTIMTFFPWPGAPRGRSGTGQATTTAFAVPRGSLEWWMESLAAAGLEFGNVSERFGERVLPLDDPDGLGLELIERDDASKRAYWQGGPVDGSHAIRGFHGVTLTVEGYERTAQLLTEVMQYRAAVDDGTRFRFAGSGGEMGAVVDVVCAPGLEPGRVAVGTVHHVAFRCGADSDQLAWRERVGGAGMNVTPVLDRQYFKSIYFREPGGVLFELATDAPGFARDEPRESLGTTLKLPPWLESERQHIEDHLPPLRAPRRAR